MQMLQEATLVDPKQNPRGRKPWEASARRIDMVVGRAEDHARSGYTADATCSHPDSLHTLRRVLTEVRAEQGDHLGGILLSSRHPGSQYAQPAFGVGYYNNAGLTPSSTLALLSAMAPTVIDASSSTMRLDPVNASRDGDVRRIVCRENMHRLRTRLGRREGRLVLNGVGRGGFEAGMSWREPGAATTLTDDDDLFIVRPAYPGGPSTFPLLIVVDDIRTPSAAGLLARSVADRQARKRQTVGVAIIHPDRSSVHIPLLIRGAGRWHEAGLIRFPGHTEISRMLAWADELAAQRVRKAAEAEERRARAAEEARVRFNEWAKTVQETAEHFISTD